MWDALPAELRAEVFMWRRRLMLPQRSAVRIQAQWRQYRTRVLLGRFRMLRYLHEFRQWNPSAQTFIARARL